MIEETIFCVLIFLSLVLLAIGFFKEQYSLVVISGIVFIVIGAFFAVGLQYTSGYLINQVNSSFTNVTVVASNYVSAYKLPLFSVFSLLGLGIIFMGVFAFYHQSATQGFLGDSGGGEDE